MRVSPGRVHVAAVAGLSAIAFVLGAVSPGIHAQAVQGPRPTQPAANAPPPTGIVLGRVVDATTGQPVAGAIVLLSGSTAPAPAAVELGVASQAAAGAAPSSAPRQIITNADGRFLFRELAHGRYAMRTTATGYLPGGYGQNRPSGGSQSLELTTDDDRLGDVTIRMWKTATISGTVTDEAGEPMIGAMVRPMRRVMTSGQPRLQLAANTTTDDRGIYRIAGLTPGDYVVGIMSSQSTVPTSFGDNYRQIVNSGNLDALMMLEMGSVSPFSPGYRVGDLLLQNQTLGRGSAAGPTSPAPGDDGRILVYPSVYYPAAAIASQATVVTLNAGDDRGHVDLQMKLAPTVRVSGALRGPNGPVANLGVQLASADAELFAGLGNSSSAVTVTDGKGAFTFLGVTPGQYRLVSSVVPRAPTTPSTTASTRVEVSGPNGSIMSMSSGGGPSLAPPPPLPTDPTLWAALPLNVAQTDLSGLSVTLQPGVKLTGRLVFDGSKEKPTGLQLQRTSVQVTPLERLTLTSTPVRVESDGTFKTAGYVPGRYTVNASLYPLPGGVTGWYFKSAVMGDRTISDAPFEIGGDTSGELVITFTDQINELSGTVTDAKGAPDKDADVLIFPADAQGWRQGSPVARRMRDLRPSDKGVFTVTGLPAGDYLVAAVSGNFPADWQDPKFLERVAGLATRVTLVEGEKKSLALATKPLR